MSSRPVLLTLEKYPKLTEGEIIGQVADWFDKVGTDEFMILDFSENL